MPLFHFKLAIHMLFGDKDGVDKWLAIAESVNCTHPGPFVTSSADSRRGSKNAYRSSSAQVHLSHEIRRPAQLTGIRRS